MSMFSVTAQSAKATFRNVTRVVRSEKFTEGAGFEVRRPFPVRGLQQFDPFLLLDEIGPKMFSPGQFKGAPDHPHRGFETISYVLEGSMEHKDSQGNSGKLHKGAVQWMTAGAGIIHCEMASQEFQKAGGLMHGFQVWVNLPAKDKMCKPRYQEYQANDIPKATSPDGKVNVVIISGEAYGKSAIIETHTPIAYLHYRVAQGGTGVWQVPMATEWINGKEGDDMNIMCYVINGKGKFGGTEKLAEGGDMVVFENGPSTQDKRATVTFTNAGEEELGLLLLAGKPLKEPMSRYGPFVMNTKEEIEQAFWDYQTGQFGKINF